MHSSYIFVAVYTSRQLSTIETFYLFPCQTRKKTVNKRELKDEIKLFIKTEKKNRNKNTIIITYRYLQCNYSFSTNNHSPINTLQCSTKTQPNPKQQLFPSYCLQLYSLPYGVTWPNSSTCPCVCCIDAALPY